MGTASKDKRHSLRDKLSLKQGGTCYYCKILLTDVHDDSSQGTLDRLFPGCLGGRYTMLNCCAACRLCNGFRGNMGASDYLLLVQMLGRTGAAERARQLHGGLGGQGTRRPKEIVALEAWSKDEWTRYTAKPKPRG